MKLWCSYNIGTFVLKGGAFIFKKRTFHCKIVDLFFVRVIHSNLSNPLATGLVSPKNMYGFQNLQIPCSWFCHGFSVWLLYAWCLVTWFKIIFGAGFLYMTFILLYLLDQLFLISMLIHVHHSCVETEFYEILLVATNNHFLDLGQISRFQEECTRFENSRWPSSSYSK